MNNSIKIAFILRAMFIFTAYGVKFSVQQWHLCLFNYFCLSGKLMLDWNKIYQKHIYKLQISLLSLCHFVFFLSHLILLLFFFSLIQKRKKFEYSNKKEDIPLVICWLITALQPWKLKREQKHRAELVNVNARSCDNYVQLTCDIL